MVVTKFFAKFRAVTGAVAVAGSLVAAHPAMANSSAAAADISAPLRASQAANQSAGGGEDEQFRNLFSSWQNFEETGLASAKAKPAIPGAAKLSAVSIPSRTPLEGLKLTSSFGMRNHPILGAAAPTRASISAPRSALPFTLPLMASSARQPGSAVTACSFRSNTAETSKPVTVTCRASTLPKARWSTRAT